MDDFNFKKNAPNRKGIQARDLFGFLFKSNPIKPGLRLKGMDIRLLFQFSNVLKHGQTIHEKARLFLEKVQNLAEADYGGLALLEGDQLNFIAGSSREVNNLSGLRIPYSAHPIWVSARTGVIQTIRLSAEPPSEKAEDAFDVMTGALGAYGIIPMVTPESVIGIIFLGFSGDQPRPLEENEIYSALSNMAGNAFNQLLTENALEKIVTERTLELDRVYHIIASVNRSTSLTEAFRQALHEILETTGFSMGSIYLMNEIENKLDLIAGVNLLIPTGQFPDHLSLKNNLEGRVIQTGKCVFEAQVTHGCLTNTPPGLTLPFSYNGLPILIQGKAIGVISMMGIPGRLLALNLINLLTSVADHLSLYIENYRLRKNAERSAVVEERARLAREFHDSVTQTLYSATLLCAAAREYLERRNFLELEENLKRLSQITQHSLKEMRLLVYELRSPALDTGGLIEAIRRRITDVEMRAGVDASIEILNYNPLDIREEEELYRIVMEGLNNSLKYANASKIKITFDLLDDNIELRIEDNGKGFDPLSIKETGGFGIRTMRERTEKLGGSFSIQSQDGNGTCISVIIPHKEIDRISPYQINIF